MTWNIEKAARLIVNPKLDDRVLICLKGLRVIVARLACTRATVKHRQRDLSRECHYRAYRGGAKGVADELSWSIYGWTIVDRRQSSYSETAIAYEASKYGVTAINVVFAASMIAR